MAMNCVRPRAFLVAALLAGWLFAPSRVQADFLRGDANRDGRIDVTDVVIQLRAMVAGDIHLLGCADAADADDDGRLGLPDALATLNFLFAAGEIPSPGPGVSGPDPSCDPLDCRDQEVTTAAIVVSELYYQPPIFRREEFIELHNRSAYDVDVSGYRFSNGVDFEFPPETVIPAGAFLLVVKEPTLAFWRSVPAPVVGPYEGYLADGGERLTLTDGDCTVEDLRFATHAPWPAGADGSSRSLERIDYLTPAGDYHAWRTSSARRGTPGEANSTAGTPPYPLIAFAAIEPEAPGSADTVHVRVTLDADAARIVRVTLRWEGVTTTISAVASVEMTLLSSGPGFTEFGAQLPPAASQSLVRYNVEVELAGGAVVLLPHTQEPLPYLSYFVHDGEVESLLPVVWLFPARRTGLVPGGPLAGAAVIQEAGDPVLFVLDGIQIRVSRNGHKVTFAKGNEYRGNRTLNIIPELGGGGTGIFAPHMEQLGFEVFRDFDALAPWAQWFRVIDYGSVGSRNTQRVVIQQIGERFLALNGLDTGGDLYKYVYTGNEKHTNLETGMQSLNEFLAALSTADRTQRREAVFQRLHLGNIGIWSAVNALIGNWDGYHNNFYLYYDFDASGRWFVIPWDLDQVFEPACATMPLTRPISGGGCNHRDPAAISRAYHLEADLDAAHRDALRAHIAPGGRFARDAVVQKIDQLETLLLDDLALQEAYLGSPRPSRRSQIQNAYATLRRYVDARITYLRGQTGE